jgi:N-[(2S)-2-amino-2-carboxyethyl]-L-glutamate dehydrogenase
MTEFTVISGATVREIITRNRREIVREVRRTYLDHHAGKTVNPRSYFLRFPDKPDSRIIALPAYLGNDHDVAGIKWVSSFPDNITQGIQRASAVLVLNDYETGYPFTLIEASQINAARTAASAVLAAEVLTGGRAPGRVAVVGAGVIGRSVLDFFAALDWELDAVTIYDRVADYASAMAGYARSRLGYTAHVAGDLASALDSADLVVLVTNSGQPYILDLDAFAPDKIVLNISLRDIGPHIIAASSNILDDVEHCLTAGTSPHLAEQDYGNRDFITGTLAQVMLGEITISAGTPAIFSPFGLGVLDLAVGSLVHRMAVDSGQAITIPNFFADTTRW